MGGNGEHPIFFMASACCRLAWGSLDIAFILYVIGFSVPYWITLKDHPDYEDLSMGVWQVCYLLGTDDRYSCNNTADIVQDIWGSGWVPGMQALITLGFVLLALSTIGVNGYIFVPSLKASISTLFLSMCFSFTSVALGGTGILVYGIRSSADPLFHKRSSLSWGFGLCLTGCILSCVGCACLLGELIDTNDARVKKRMRRKTERRDLTPTAPPLCMNEMSRPAVRNEANQNQANPVYDGENHQSRTPNGNQSMQFTTNINDMVLSQGCEGHDRHETGQNQSGISEYQRIPTQMEDQQPQRTADHQPQTNLNIPGTTENSTTTEMGAELLRRRVDMFSVHRRATLPPLY